MATNLVVDVLLAASLAAIGGLIKMIFFCPDSLDESFEREWSNPKE